MPRRATPSRARRAAPNMPRSPREDGVNNPSRGPRRPIAPPARPIAPPVIGPRKGGKPMPQERIPNSPMPDRRAGLPIAPPAMGPIAPPVIGPRKGGKPMPQMTETKQDSCSSKGAQWVPRTLGASLLRL
jgi:hypothetical protein